MARRAYACTLGQALPNGAYNTSGGVATPLTTTAAATSDAATAEGLLAVDVAAAVAVLVADGATPTQAHVNDLNTAWGLLETAIAATAAAATAGASAATAQNAILDIDVAVLTNQNAVRAAVRNILQSVAGSGLSTG